MLPKVNSWSLRDTQEYREGYPVSTLGILVSPSCTNVLSLSSHCFDCLHLLNGGNQRINTLVRKDALCYI